jgi:hypothetical protein
LRCAWARALRRGKTQIFERNQHENNERTMLVGHMQSANEKKTNLCAEKQGKRSGGGKNK